MEQTSEVVEVTDPDVQKYLDGKQDDDHVGVAADATACLIKEVIQQKYPAASFICVALTGIYLKLIGIFFRS